MNNDFVYAIVHGSIEKLTAILDSKDDNNCIADMLGGPAVHKAALYGQLEAAKLLLDKGANVDAISKDGNGALHAAVKRADVAFVNLLIQHRCNINARNTHRFTAVMIAVENGCTEILSVLLQNGADVNAMDSLGDTAIHFAVKHEKLDILEILMQHKCNINAQNGKGNTAIMMAVKKGSQEILALLTRAGADLNAKNKEGCNALILSITTLNLKAVRFLLEHLDNNKQSFDINATDINGQTALMLAANSRRSDIVKLLCDHGVNVNIQNSISGQTALHYGVIVDDLPTVTTLIEAGACVNVINTTSKTPLYFSTSKTMTEILLKAGAYKAEFMYSITKLPEESISKISERPTLIHKEPSLFYTDIKNIDNNEQAYINGEISYELHADECKLEDDATTEDASRPNGLPKSKKIKSKIRKELEKELNKFFKCFWSKHALSSTSGSIHESTTVSSNVKIINVKECTHINIHTTSSVVVGDSNIVQCSPLNAHSTKDEIESLRQWSESFKKYESTQREDTGSDGGKDVTKHPNVTKSKQNSEDAFQTDSDLTISHEESQNSDAPRNISSPRDRAEEISDTKSHKDASRLSINSLPNQSKRTWREGNVIDKRSTTGELIKTDVIVTDQAEKNRQDNLGPLQVDAVSVPDEPAPPPTGSVQDNVRKDISTRRAIAEEMSDSKSVIEPTRLLDRNDATRWSSASLLARNKETGSDDKRVPSTIHKRGTHTGIKPGGEREKEKPNTLGSRLELGKEQPIKENTDTASCITKL